MTSLRFDHRLQLTCDLKPGLCTGLRRASARHHWRDRTTWQSQAAFPRDAPSRLGRSFMVALLPLLNGQVSTDGAAMLQLLFSYLRPSAVEKSVYLSHRNVRHGAT